MPPLPRRTASVDVTMIDAALRSMAREASQDDPLARIRLLVARVRAGTLSNDNLRLAAFAGDKDAQVACGCVCTPGILNRRADCWQHVHGFPSVGTVYWFEDLMRLDSTLVTRACVAVARRVIASRECRPASYEPDQS